MILTCAHPAGPQHRQRRRTDIFHGWRTDYIAAPGEPGSFTPQAFLVEQDPHFQLTPHYHLQHQFQVMVRGSGTLGAHAIAPFATHYASRESGYGPIVSAQDGLAYFTLRVIADNSTWPLPEHRESMTKGLRKRQRYADAPAAALGPAGGQGVDAVMPLDGHGCGAWFVRLAPGESAVLPDARQGAGRFHIVASGSMQVEGEALDPLSVVFTSNDEDAFRIVAGGEGLQAMVVQFPADALE